MGLDFAGLAALSGVQPWQEIREERNRDSQRIAVLNAMSQQKNQQQQLAAQDIQQHLDTIGQIKVLSQDRDRIKAKNDALQEEIQNGIRNSHGNLSKYLETGGKTALQAYRNNLLESDEVQQGLMNSLNHNMATQAQMKGETLMPTTWKERKDNQPATYEENYAAFQRGETHDLNFAGSYKNPDVGDLQEEFAKIPGPETKDGTPGPVNANDVYTKAYHRATNKGLGDPESRHFASNYAKQYDEDVSAGRQQPYMYKGHVEEKSKQVAMITSIGRLELARQKQEEKLKNSGAYSGDVLGKMTTPQDKGGYALPAVMPEAKVHDYMALFGQKPDAGVAEDATKPIQIYQTKFPDKVIKDTTAKTKLGGLEWHKSKKGEEWEGWTGQIKNADKAISAHTLQPYPGNLNDYPGYVKDIQGFTSLPSPDGKGNKLYAKITYHFTNQADMGQGGWNHLHGGFGASNSHGFWPDSPTGASQGDISGDKHDLTALIPVDYGKDDRGQDIDPLGSQQYNFDLHNKASQKYATQDDEFFAGTEIGGGQTEP